MRSDDEAEDLRRRHAALRVRMPRVWNAFFARFGRLRPVQLEAMPVVVSGVSTLITAPTAGGKTEASVAPICERLLLERWSGLSVLLVTPTRALVNDIFQRLERPLETLGIRIARKTSDHGAVGDSTQFLVTTPESLESLLTFRRERLGQVRAVILDETVRVQHVRPNLAAEGDVLLRLVELGHPLALLLLFKFEQARPQDLHGHRLVLVL